MNEEMNKDMLREEVNPVYLTAQSCLKISAQLGDEDSIKLKDILGFDDAHDASAAKALDPEMLKIVYKLMPGFNSITETRFGVFNEMINDTGAKQVVDLPCGYTSRGIKLAKSGIRYFGFDLPAVVDAIGPAVKQVIGDNDNIRYEAVDATNYSSLRKGLSSASGELFITTEGLLMYFTQPEIEEVFRNIRRLLLEFGGKWVTVDNNLNDVQPTVLAAVIDKNAPPDMLNKIGTLAAGAVSKAAFAQNVFFDKDRSKAEQFVKDMGFDLEFISMGDYIPDVLRSLKGLPEESIEAVRNAYKGVNIWVMTARAEENESFSHSDKDFSCDVRLNGDVLNVSLGGRLDTITSPDLLALYKEASSKTKISSIAVDMKNLEYVSSAGLRE